MARFAIQRGPTPLCTWDTQDSSATFHPGTKQVDDAIILRESEKFGFVLSPCTSETEFRITIGDVPLADLSSVVEDAGGVEIGGNLYWRDMAYLESAHGWTPLLLESKSTKTTTGKWTQVFLVNVYVLPSKLSEERYDQMASDLRTLSRSLLVDLYGKSRQTLDVRLAREAKTFRSWEEELATLEIVVERIAGLLQAIGQRPASRIKTIRCQRRYWGQERITSDTIDALCRKGIDARYADRPILIASQRKSESFDIAEHRVVRAFLDIVNRRAAYCEDAAREHIKAIQAESRMRNVHIGGSLTLYESVDLPKIKRLMAAMQKARFVDCTATALASLPFLRDARPELVAVRDGAFQRSPEYEALLVVIRQYLMENAMWYEGDRLATVTKLTSRLFEQWGFLQIVEAFRKNGLELREWSDALRQNLQSRFVLDFDRGLMFEGMATANLRLRLRYEPWILGETAAVAGGETLYRGSQSNVAWSPDVVIECLKKDNEDWRPVYGIVMDCKYATHIKEQHWHDTAKYLTIRSTRTRRQIVKQLWLISPGEVPSLESEDPAVTFDDNGPSCAPDEAVRFRLEVLPAPSETESAGDAWSAFDRFAHGTMSFLRREFASSA